MSEYYVAVYRARTERGMSIVRGNFRLGSIVSESEESCISVSKREDFVRAVKITIDSETGEVGL